LVDEVRFHLDQTKVTGIPMYAGGCLGRTVDVMAMGIPVVGIP
jgi:hypothetical protein